MGALPPTGRWVRLEIEAAKLDLKAGAKRRDVDAALQGHVIAQGELMGRYSKK